MLKGMVVVTIWKKKPCAKRIFKKSLFQEEPKRPFKQNNVYCEYSK